MNFCYFGAHWSYIARLANGRGFSWEDKNSLGIPGTCRGWFARNRK